MGANRELVDRFLTIWWAGDVEGASACLTDDFVWENMPWPEPEKASRGRDLFERVSRGWRAICERGHFVDRCAYEVGDTVILERVETFTVNGHESTLHVAGFFTIRDGKIAGWRDYYDNATYMRQMEAAGAGDLASDLSEEARD